MDEIPSSVTKHFSDLGQVTDPLLGSGDFTIKTGIKNTYPLDKQQGPIV